MSNYSWLPRPNLSIITLDDLEYPRLVAVYSIYWDVSLVYTTSLFCFMLHMIITKSSPEMGTYKWYLVHQLTWSYIFDVYLGLSKFVPLWPFFLGYSAGIYADLKDRNAPAIELIPCTVLSVGMGFSIYVSVLYRYVQASPFSNFYKYYNVLYIRLPVYIVIFISLQALVCVPLLFVLPPQINLEATMTAQYPVLIPIFEKHPSIFGYEAKEEVIRYHMIVTVIMVVLGISVFLLYLNFLRILRKNKQHLSVGTYNMQLMLNRTLFIQIFIFGLLLIVPIMIAFSLTLFGLKCATIISLFAVAILGTHAFIDFCILTYFIRSYREYVKECFNKMRKWLGFKVPTVEVTPLGPSTVSDLPSNIH